MNRFELFTLIYFVLDAYYEDEVKTNEKLNTLLSDMNPFVWEDLNSADPSVYKHFCDFIGEKKITMENSLTLAKSYISTIDYVNVAEAFTDMTDEEWIVPCKDYLSSDHKGADL